MNKKGFTLIELLAVIVVLAIIALIATPLVMNTINNAKKGAAERSADGYIKAVELMISTYAMDNINVVNGNYTTDAYGNLTANGVTYQVDFSGSKPKAGSMIKIEDKQVSKSGLLLTYNDKYKIEYINNKLTATEISTSVPVVYAIGDEVKLTGTTKVARVNGADTCSLTDVANTSWHIVGINGDNYTLYSKNLMIPNARDTFLELTNDANCSSLGVSVAANGFTTSSYTSSYNLRIPKASDFSNIVDISEGIFTLKKDEYSWFPTSKLNYTPILDVTDSTRYYTYLGNTFVTAYAGPPKVAYRPIVEVNKAQILGKA